MDNKATIKKGKADGRIYDVMTHDEYVKILEYETGGNIAVEENGYMYPRRGANDDRPGIYSNSVYSVYKHPKTEDELDNYSMDNVIDFDSSSMVEYINKTNRLKNMEREVLSSTDDKFMPSIHENDEPELIALKKAVTAKGIDLSKYAPRFGSSYQNDKRIFNDNRISMFKLKSMLDNLDLKGTIRIQDKNPDVPNPMGKVIEVDLNDGGEVAIDEKK